jgi:CHAT domain-containing protein/Tfp pilus assembly protein PilF
MTRRILWRSGRWSAIWWVVLCSIVFVFSLSSGFRTPIRAAGSYQDLQLLEPGQKIEREIAGGQAHLFRLRPAAEHFLRVVVEQRGIDVAVTLSGPEGKMAAQMDRAYGTRGRESVVWLADTARECQVEVRAPDQAAAGRYEISVSDWRVATAQDRQRLAAQQAFIAAERLNAQQTGEARHRSIEQYETALALWREVGDKAEVAATLTDIGSVYFALSEPQKAVAFFTESLALRRAVGDSTGEADTLNRMGLNYLRLDDYQRALEHYHQALEIRRSLGDIKQQASLLNNIGGVYQESGESEAARGYYQQSLIPRRAAGDRDGEAATLNNLGGVAHELGDIPSALNYYAQALEIRRERKNRFGEAQSLNNLGAVYQGSGDQQKALLNYQQALAIWEALGNKRDQASTLNNIGAVYSSLGEPQRALDYYQRALALRREANDRRGEADTLTNLGIIHRDLKEPKKALEYLGQALQIRRAARDRLGEAMTLGNIGRVYVSTSEWRLALENFLPSLQISQAIGHPRSEGTTLSYLARVYEAMGETQKALDDFARALKIHQAVENRESEASVRHSMARLERQRGDLEAARRHLEVALELTESLRAKIGGQQLRASYFATVQRYYSSYIDLLMQLHQQQPDEGHAALALQISERSRARSLLGTLTEAKVDIRQGVDEKLLERERSLRRLMSDKMNRQLRLLGAKYAAERAAVDKELAGLTTQYLETEEQIRATSPHYAALTQPEPLNLSQIQQQVLDAGTLLLEYALGEERSHLWAVTQSSLTAFELPKRAVIEDAARKVQSLLLARTETKTGETDAAKEARLKKADADYPPAAAALSRMLLGPVAGQLGLKRLVIVADGALQLVPFAALPTPVNDDRASDSESAPATKRQDPVAPWRPLIAGHEIINLPSASTLSVLRSETAERARPSKLIAVLADPVFDATDRRARPGAAPQPSAKSDNDAARETSASQLNIGKTLRISFGDGQPIPRLSYSRLEANEVMKLAPAAQRRIALDFEASYATATDPKLADYRIVHFATHSLVNDEQPELSAILLSMVDREGRPQKHGLLRFGEIYNLKLPADLIVLSACQTALGKDVRGEGLIGLTRGFMYAGARRVMASLWSVDDKATAELMRRFYKHLFERRGARHADALRQAQIEMWKSGQPPFYWAAFTLQGEWRAEK